MGTPIDCASVFISECHERVWFITMGMVCFCLSISGVHFHLKQDIYIYIYNYVYITGVALAFIVLA